MIEFSAHDVVSLEVETHKSTNNTWVSIKALNKDGDQIYELTNFASSGGAIQFQFGSDDE